MDIFNYARTNTKLEAFNNKSFINILNSLRGCLDVDGRSDSESLLNEHFNEYKEMEKFAFLSESLDPKKDYLPQKYFYKTDVYKKTEEVIYRTINGIFSIFFLRGSRSIGKTISQNIFLKENDEFLERKNIFWVRCDCKKILKIIENRNISINDIDDNIINQYLNIQLLYVFAKHYNDDNRPFFKEMYSLMQSERAKTRKSRDRKRIAQIDINKGIEDLQEFIKNLSDNIWHFKNVRSDDKYHYGREIIIGLGLKKENISKRSFDNWVNVSVQIQNKLKEKGYKILKIIDGIDNYSKFDSAGEYDEKYEFLLEKLKICHREYEKTNQQNNESIVVVLRRNTYHEYNSKYKKGKQEGTSGRINSISIERNSIYEKEIILEKRFSFLKDNYSNSYIFKIFDMIVNNKSNDPILKEFLDADKHVGYYLRNNWNLIPSLIYYQKKYELNNYNLIHFKNNYQAVNLLLNGFFSLDSYCREEDFLVEEGKSLFNIFYYDSSKYKSMKWQGLCCTRIIQHMSTKDTLKKEELIKDIKNMFNFDILEINKKISKLLDYSLLRFCTNNDANDNNRALKITRKGKAALKLIYSNVDILYHCALDTPLPVDLIKFNYIVPHHNNINIKDYAISCLKTSHTFIQYLKYKDTYERLTLKNKFKTKYRDDDYKIPLFLPNIEASITKRLEELHNSLKPEIQHLFQEYLLAFSS